MVIIGQFGGLLATFGGLALVMLCVEAFARGYLRQFVTTLLAAAIAGVLVWLIITEAVSNWRPAVAACSSWRPSSCWSPTSATSSPSANRHAAIDPSGPARCAASPQATETYRQSLGMQNNPCPVQPARQLVIEWTAQLEGTGRTRAA